MQPRIWLSLLAIPVLFAQAQDPESVRTQRTAQLGKLWGRIRAFHPALSTKPIDWDKALVDAIAKLDKSSSRADFLRAVEAMLATLGDPATALNTAKSPSQVECPKNQKPFTWLTKDILLIHLNDPGRFQNSLTETGRYLTELRAEMTKASSLVWDLRPEKRKAFMTAESASMQAAYTSEVIENLLPEMLDAPLQLPAKRVRAHQGHRSFDSLPYSNGVFLAGARFVQSRGNRKDSVFLINDESVLPSEVMALQKAGRARIVTEGDSQRDWAAETATFNLGEGITGSLRIADWVFADGSSSCRADQQVSPSAGIDATAPAIQIALQHVSPRASRATVSPLPASELVPVFRPEALHAEPLLPSKALRILAAIKFWSTVDLFFPHKKLMDRPWEGQLTELIPLMERADSIQAYHLAVAGMVARLGDSHGLVTEAVGGIGEGGEPDGLKAFFGTGKFPVALAVVNGKVLVLRTKGQLPVHAGFQPGDEIFKVDGEPIQVRMKRIRPFVSASTQPRLELLSANLALRGPIGQDAVVEVRRPDGVLVNLKFSWVKPEGTWSGAWRDGEPFKVITRDIGYIDFDRIRPAQAKDAVEAMRKVKSVILDIRGYPTEAANEIAAYFSNDPAIPYATTNTPLYLGETGPDGPLTMTQPLQWFGVPQKPLGHKVVVLVDERSQSNAENVGLLLEATSKATIIGGQTSGVNGNITNIDLPGGLRVYMTGMEVRRADGRQFQRIGLHPHIPVRPTAKGLAEGRDEVLERAIRFLEEDK